MTNTSTTRMQCMQVWGGNHATETMVATTGLDVWLHSDPCGDASAGGDLFYLSSCSSGRITRLALADVSGHGRRVATIADRLQRLMHTHINRIDQTTLVSRLNHDFSRIGDAAIFATALVGTYFLPTRTLTVTNAGHPPPLLYSARHGSWSPLVGPPRGRRPADMPLGMFGDTVYGQLRVRLGDGDRVLWLTDGVLEAEDDRGEMLGTDGVLAVLNGMAAGEPRAIIPALFTRLRAMQAGNLRDDDTTAVLLTPNAQAVSLRDNLLSPLRFLIAALRPARWGASPSPVRPPRRGILTSIRASIYSGIRANVQTDPPVGTLPAA